MTIHVIDSSLDAFVAANRTVDFTSMQAEQQIYLFKTSLYMIGSTIECDIKDESDQEKIKLLEGKIDKIPEIAKIYRSYIARDRDSGSLSPALFKIMGCCY